MLSLDPELQPQGGDVEGGAQVCGGGGGVRPHKTKFCHRLLVKHPLQVGSCGGLAENQNYIRKGKNR